MPSCAYSNRLGATLSPRLAECLRSSGRSTKPLPNYWGDRNEGSCFVIESTAQRQLRAAGGGRERRISGIGSRGRARLRRGFPTGLSKGLPEMPKARWRLRHRRRISLRVSRSLSTGAGIYRRDSNLLVRHLGAAQSLPRSHLLLLRRLLS